MKNIITTTGLVSLIFSPASISAAVVTLGSADSFSILGASTVTNTGSSVVTGNLGLSPGTSITGFPPGVVLGVVHTNDSLAISAQTDASAAFDNLELLTVTTDLTGQDLGQTLSAGIYNFDTSAGLSGNLVLDGPGDFVFLIGSTLTTGSGSTVSLINGASAEDVFFRVGSSATLGSTSTFVGNVIAETSVTANTGAGVQGRLIALNGAVTLDNNTVTVPVPEPSCAAFSLLAGLGLLVKRRRA